MKTVIAVLRGGPNQHYDASLESGAAVLAALDPERYDARDVFVTHDGYWHIAGSSVLPEKALRGVDVVLNCIHGRYGIDGWLHQLVNKLGHKIVGSHPGALTVTFHKETSKRVATRLGIMVPAHQTVSSGQDLDSAVFHLFRSFPMPAIIKPVGGSASLGLSYASDLVSLRSGLDTALVHAPKALVEECIAGTEATVGVVEGLRGKHQFSFSVGELTGAQRQVLSALGRRIHLELGLRHYSASDFIVNPKGVWYLETNALPELHPESRFVNGLTAAGVDMKEFVEHVVALAQK